MRRDLTPRQAQILDLVAAGLGDKEIAGKLGVSTNTVRTHLQRLYREHGIRNRAEAAVAWIAVRSEAAVAVTVLPPSPSASHAFRLRLGLALALVLALLPAAGLQFRDTAHLIVAGARVAPASIAGPSPVAAATPSSTAGPTQPASAPGVGTVASSSAVSSLPAAPATTTGTPDASTVTPALGQLALVNSARALAGLPPLSWDNCLESVAAQSAQLVAGQGYITDTGGPRRALACSGASRQPAESAGYWSAPDDARLNSMLLSQPAAKARILGPYRRLGAAWAMSPSGIAYLVAEFG